MFSWGGVGQRSKDPTPSASETPQPGDPLNASPLQVHPGLLNLDLCVGFLEMLYQGSPRNQPGQRNLMTNAVGVRGLLPSSPEWPAHPMLQAKLMIM